MAPLRNETPTDEYARVIGALSKRLFELEKQESGPGQESGGPLKKAQTAVQAVYQLVGIFIAFLTLVVWLVVLREDVKRHTDELAQGRMERTAMRSELWELKIKLAELKR